MLGLGRGLVDYDIPRRDYLVFSSFTQTDTNDENLSLYFAVVGDTLALFQSRPGYSTTAGTIIDGVTCEVTATNNTTGTTGTATFQVFRKFSSIMEAWHFLAPATSSFTVSGYELIDLTSDFSADLSANADPNSYSFSAVLKFQGDGIWDDAAPITLTSIGIDQA